MLSTLGDPFTRIISPKVLFTSKETFGFVELRREYIKLSPISSAIIPHRTPDGRLAKTGYVKLSAFSQVHTLVSVNNII
ncbi:hypothetical protein LINPERPRIM_LOCUS9038 [Linum perenne]